MSETRKFLVKVADDENAIDDFLRGMLVLQRIGQIEVVKEITRKSETVTLGGETFRTTTVRSSELRDDD